MLWSEAHAPEVVTDGVCRPARRDGGPRATGHLSSPACGSLRRIVSGGQTGADRAALDVALELGYECGGWVPRGRTAEDGTIPACYPNMVETTSSQPRVRTERNVRDADGTVVITRGPAAGGSGYTLAVARRLGRPALHLDLTAQSVEAAARTLSVWLERVRPHVLNVAGPRSSQDGEIHALVRSLLVHALRPATGRPGGTYARGQRQGGRDSREPEWDDMKDPRWTEVGRYSGQFDADLDREALEAAGIPVMVKGSLTGAFGPGYVGWTPEGLRLFVPDELAGRARQLLGGAQGGADDDDAGEYDDDEFDDDDDDEFDDDDDDDDEFDDDDDDEDDEGEAWQAGPRSRPEGGG
jgi:hypothetical protein